MKIWKIHYWYSGSKANPVEKWLDCLENDQLISVSKELKLLGLGGPNLKLPHSKALGKGIFELRERHYGLRIYYGFLDDAIIVLSAGDKSSQKKDISIAYKRLLLIKRG